MQLYSRHDMYHYLCSFWHVLFNFDNILIRSGPRITWRHHDSVHTGVVRPRCSPTPTLSPLRVDNKARYEMRTRSKLQPCSVSRVRADWCDASWGDVSRSLSSAASVEPSGQCVASRCTGAQLWPSVQLLYTVHCTTHYTHLILHYTRVNTTLGACLGDCHVYGGRCIERHQCMKS